MESHFGQPRWVLIIASTTADWKVLLVQAGSSVLCSAPPQNNGLRCRCWCFPMVSPGQVGNFPRTSQYMAHEVRNCTITCCVGVQVIPHHFFLDSLSPLYFVFFELFSLVDFSSGFCYNAIENCTLSMF